LTELGRRYLRNSTISVSSNRWTSSFWGTATSGGDRSDAVVFLIRGDGFSVYVGAISGSIKLVAVHNLATSCSYKLKGGCTCSYTMERTKVRFCLLDILTYHYLCMKAKISMLILSQFLELAKGVYVVRQSGVHELTVSAAYSFPSVTNATQATLVAP
jgi:hypothetical protein